jgi:hypothetical protein
MGSGQVETVEPIPTSGRSARDLPPEGRRVVERYRDLAVARFGDEIDRIVLYGSRARGDWHRDSDWDLAVFLRHPVTGVDQRLVSEIGHDVMCATGAIVQSVALPADRWDAGDEFIRHMHQDGVVIHG